MKNYEKFAKEIAEIAVQCMAVVDGKPAKCDDVDCTYCRLDEGINCGHTCSDSVREWLYADDGEPEFMAETVEEYGRVAGQNEAWDMAVRIAHMDVGVADELFDMCDLDYILECYTYAEAAARVADWERQKEEIYVGDVVEHIETCRIGVVTNGVVNELGCYKWVEGITTEGKPFEWLIDDIQKTGNTIPVQKWLKQIGE